MCTQLMGVGVYLCWWTLGVYSACGCVCLPMLVVPWVCSQVVGVYLSVFCVGKLWVCTQPVGVGVYLCWWTLGVYSACGCVCLPVLVDPGCVVGCVGVGIYLCWWTLGV